MGVLILSEKFLWHHKLFHVRLVDVTLFMIGPPVLVPLVVYIIIIIITIKARTYLALLYRSSRNESHFASNLNLIDWNIFHVKDVARRYDKNRLFLRI